jgi:hypothetical protein
LVIKTPDTDWIQIRIGIQPKILDPDPYQMYTDPKHWFIVVINNWQICCSALVSYKLMTRKEERAPLSIHSLTAEFCGLSVSDPPAAPVKERDGLLRANFAHRFLAYTQSHTIFR